MSRQLLRLFTWSVIQLVMLVGAAHAATPNAATTYYFTDPQGTVLATTDAAGNVITNVNYRPYGQQASGDPASGPAYTGHVADDDSGLIYMQARYYDSLSGRFLSVDPEPAAPGDTWLSNRYTYANDNPVRYVDPDGRQAFGSAEVARGKYTDVHDSEFVTNAFLFGIDIDYRPPHGSGAVQSVVTPFEFGAARVGLRAATNIAELVFDASRPVSLASDGAFTALRIERGATRNSPFQIRTAASSESAQNNLAKAGFASRTSKDGSAVVMTKGKFQYTFYSNAKSTGTPSASIKIDNQEVAKIRFNEKIDP